MPSAGCSAAVKPGSGSAKDTRQSCERPCGSAAGPFCYIHPAFSRRGPLSNRHRQFPSCSGPCRDHVSAAIRDLASGLRDAGRHGECFRDAVSDRSSGCAGRFRRDVRFDWIGAGATGANDTCTRAARNTCPRRNTTPAPAAAPSPTQAAPAEPIGNVATLTGAATVTRNNTSTPLKLQDDIYLNDVLQTSANSTLGITFNDATTFNLTANASITVDNYVL